MTYGLYKVWLEKEAVHRLKRFYLLAILLVSVSAPLIPANRWHSHPIDAAHSVLPVAHVKLPLVAPFAEPADPAAPENSSWPSGWLLPFLLGTGLFTLRFVRNMVFLLGQARRQPRRQVPGAVLVHSTAPNLPFTFLHYVFVDKAAFSDPDIHNELLTHELVHARQRHTLDILLIELLLCLGWFNPILWQFKKAIQLNHEFLADETVNRKFQRITDYQRLILSRMQHPSPMPLTSAFTFQTTKQRFIMMTTHTPVFRKWLAGCTAIAFLLVLPLLFGTSTIAQTTQPSVSPTRNAKPPQAIPKTSDSDFEQRFADKLVAIPIHPGKPIVRKTYAQLSPEEKKRVRLVPPQGPKTPTEAVFASWKNPKKFGVWVDGKRTRNFASTSLKASDIASYSRSYVHKNARQPEGYLYQIDLMTHAYYQNYLKESAENPFLILIANESGNTK